MKRVRIIGGGMTGILAAFQAHRLGAREIDLHERFDRLGGIALPDEAGGSELREGCIYFGPETDPIRSLLQEHGVRFEEFDNTFGSVSKGPKGLAYLQDFGGPSLSAPTAELSPLEGNSLADRLACYHDALAEPLSRYVTWHVGCEPAELHESAAIPLAINRIYNSGVALDELADAKRTNPLADELFGIPRSLWGYTGNLKASLPVGGYTQLFRHCREALEAIGVRLHTRNLARPVGVLEDLQSDEVLVWAASPTPLFKAAGMRAPKAPAKLFATHVFAARWTGALPFYVQNFTAEGSCFRVYIYESAGQTLLTAECVEKVAGDAVSDDIHMMLDGFEGELELGELLHSSVKPRWLFHSVETIAALDTLARTLKAQTGGNFVTGAWEIYAKGEKFADVEAQLQAVLSSGEARKAS